HGALPPLPLRRQSRFVVVAVEVIDIRQAVATGYTRRYVALPTSAWIRAQIFCAVAAGVTAAPAASGAAAAATTARESASAGRCPRTTPASLPGQGRDQPAEFVPALLEVRELVVARARRAEEDDVAGSRLAGGVADRERERVVVVCGADHAAELV